MGMRPPDSSTRLCNSVWLECVQETTLTVLLRLISVSDGMFSALPTGHFQVKAQRPRSKGRFCTLFPANGLLNGNQWSEMIDRANDFGDQTEEFWIPQIPGDSNFCRVSVVENFIEAVVDLIQIWLGRNSSRY